MDEEIIAEYVKPDAALAARIATASVWLYDETEVDDGYRFRIGHATVDDRYYRVSDENGAIEVNEYVEAWDALVAAEGLTQAQRDFDDGCL